MTALVILPGLDGTAVLHAAFAEAARSRFAAVMTISYPTDQILGYAELETLVRRALPRDRPFVLLGQSFSGPVAISVAADPPPNLVGLVLSTTFATPPVPLAVLIRRASTPSPDLLVESRKLERDYLHIFCGDYPGLFSTEAVGG